MSNIYRINYKRYNIPSISYKSFQTKENKSTVNEISREEIERTVIKVKEIERFLKEHVNTSDSNIKTVLLIVNCLKSYESFQAIENKSTTNESSREKIERMVMDVKKFEKFMEEHKKKTKTEIILLSIQFLTLITFCATLTVLLGSL